MTGKTLEFIIGDSENGMRLDRALSTLVRDSSRSFLQELIRNGSVCIDGKAVTVPRFPVKNDMKISVIIPEPEEKDTLAVESGFDFDVIYEDDVMLVINKPAGIAVHPGAGNPDGTIVNALLGRYPGFQELFSGIDVRPGIVHRLDKDTTGCLVIAKTPQAQYKLGMAFAERKTSKVYWTMVRGVPAQNTMEINNFIGRHPVNRQKMAVVERGGKLAVSRYRVLKSGTIGNEKVSLVEVAIFTGRTHQIRVHMAHIGNPVLGDQLYGGSRTVIEGAERQMLHARYIEIPHPESGEIMKFTAGTPQDFAALMEKIKQ